MESKQHFFSEKNEKLPFLYDASHNKEIQTFEPRAKSVRDLEEGSVIFATPDLALVTPIEKTDIQSALDAMIENGVQVFFVDKKIFNRIKHDADFFDVIRTLESENKRRGKNVVEFTNEK